MGELSRRLLLAGAAFGLLAGPGAGRGHDAQRRHGRRPEHGRLRQRLSLAPASRRQHPGVRVQAVGTGPGRRRLAEDRTRSSTRKQGRRTPPGTSTSPWSTRRWPAQMVKEDLLAKYRGRHRRPASWSAARRPRTRSGTDVAGYVMPMFHSQIAIAYNPALVKDPPKNYAELADWARKNPKGSATTASRAACRASASSSAGSRPTADLGPKLEKGPYDPASSPRSRYGARRAEASSTGTSP